MRMVRFMRDVQLGIKNLLLHKLRSVLTMLGVVFGVGSVIAMLAVGEGASKEALEQIRKLGSHNIIITSLQPMDESGQNTTVQMSIYGLLYADVQRIVEGFPMVKRVVPVKEVRKEGRLRQRALELRVVGTLPEWFALVQRPLVAGRVISQRDNEMRNTVAVLTEYGARRLLAAEATVGESLRIGGNYFEVIGIIQSEETSSGGM